MLRSSRKCSCGQATGERLYTRWEFQDIIAASAVQIVQPDIITSGGIWELRKIAAQAESREIGIAPHMPYGPISFIACLHLAAATPNHVIQEGGGNIAVSRDCACRHPMRPRTF